MQTWGLLPAGAEDSSRGVVPEAERLVGEGPADPAEELRFFPEEKGELFSSFKKCILRCSKRRGGCLDPPPTSPPSAIRRLPLLASSPPPPPRRHSTSSRNKSACTSAGKDLGSPGPGCRASERSSVRNVIPAPDVCPVVSKATREPGEHRHLSGLLSPSSHPSPFFLTAGVNCAF